MPNFTQRSEAQRQASRRNGAKSQGPRSPRQPAPSRAVVLNTESSERYQALLNSFLEHFAPATPAETSAVEHFVAAEWRLRRLLSTEASLLDLQIDQDRPSLPGTDTPTRTALALHELIGLDRISRAEARLLRNQHRALVQLQQLQKLRAKPNNSLIPHEEEPQPNPAETRATHQTQELLR